MISIVFAMGGVLIVMIVGYIIYNHNEKRKARELERALAITLSDSDMQPKRETIVVEWERIRKRKYSEISPEDAELGICSRMFSTEDEANRFMRELDAAHKLLGNQYGNKVTKKNM